MTRTALQGTADFYQASPGLRLFRLALGASQRLWPPLAVRAATRAVRHGSTGAPQAAPG